MLLLDRIRAVVPAGTEHEAMLTTSREAQFRSVLVGPAKGTPRQVKDDGLATLQADPPQSGVVCKGMGKSENKSGWSESSTGWPVAGQGFATSAHIMRTVPIQRSPHTLRTLSSTNRQDGDGHDKHAAGHVVERGKRGRICHICTFFVRCASRDVF